MCGTITLKGNKKVQWNVDPVECGRWFYTWSSDEGGTFFIEFSAAHRSTWVKHVFVQCSEDVAVLLPKDEEVYTDKRIWFPYSRAHKNSAGVVIKKLPRMESAIKDVNEYVPDEKQTGNVVALQPDSDCTTSSIG